MVEDNALSSGAWLSRIVAGMVSHIITSWVRGGFWNGGVASHFQVGLDFEVRGALGSVSVLVQVESCEVMVWG